MSQLNRTVGDFKSINQKKVPGLTTNSLSIPYKVTLDDIKAQEFEKNRFSMTGYALPSNEMHMKPPTLGKQNKEKLDMGVIEHGAKLMSWVPAPVKYEKGIDWNKNFPSRNYGRFLTAKRYMMSEQIENEAKKKVNYHSGKNPGPANYEIEK